MDALILSINGVRQIAAELREESSVSVSVSWIGGTDNSIFTVDVARCQDDVLHRWEPFRIPLGDRISIRTADVLDIDNPTESLTNAEQYERARSQPKMVPNPDRILPPMQILGTLDWYVNQARILSTPLSNQNMLSVECFWLGDRTGMFTVHLGSDVSLSPAIPSIAFGDEITFQTSPH